MLLVDSHCDTIDVLMEKGGALMENSGHVSLSKLLTYEKAVQFFAVWLNDGLAADAYANTLAALTFFKNEAAKNAATMGIVRDYADIMQNISRGKVSALLTVEGGEALEGSLEKLHHLYAADVRSVTLTWNRPNALGEPSAAANAGGLSPFGKAAVCEMNALGMLVDVSHLSEKGFWDVAAICEGPFIASHSNARALCPHPRNLTDAQIKAAAASGGVIGVNLYPPFLTGGYEASMSDVLRHIDHLVKTGGEHAVGLGGDFDGIEHTPSDMTDITCYHILYAKLKRRYGEQIAAGICGGNYMRVLAKVLK